ncbi:MAG: S1 RNA-binding domain-containing protein, partial [Succinivibrionaceae bacterium]|nr:S1 RNA-binding domain-containing protein [Succinivibrionaceae bacterium]
DYLEKSIGTGEQFTGSIFDVNYAGFRARLAENGAVVFVPGSTICADRSRLKGVYDEGRMYLDGNVLFEVGMDVKLVIAAVNHDTRSITANLANAIVIPEKKPEGEDAAKNPPADKAHAEPVKDKPAFNPLEPEAETKAE